MATLGVNIDHVATLRQARGVDYPDPVKAAKIAEQAGADQITCHLREDRRHIQDEDVPAIQKVISVPLNLEMAATQEMLAFACKIKPEKITLVPERREELTTEGGLDVLGQKDLLKPLITKLRSQNIFISLFIDPDLEQTRASQNLGVDAVEFHTGTYCNTQGEEQRTELTRLQQACALAKDLSLFVAAGHGLNYENISPVKAITEIKEFNIGHSLVAHALMVGWGEAVGQMKDLLKK